MHGFQEARSQMIIREYESRDTDQLVCLISVFRVTLSALRGIEREPDIDAARDELGSFTPPRFRLYVAESGDELVGFIVCKIEDNVVWAESLYVIPTRRRTGIASLLYQEAERLAEDVGCDTVYNWVHPNNDDMIRFLEKRGYTVLNLIEIRGRRSGEEPTSTVRVAHHTFEY